MVRTLACGSLLIALAGLSGCGLNSGSPDIAKAASSTVKATGAVYGGQPPVTGATVQLYAVGTAGFGSASTPLVSATITTSDGTGVANSNANAGNANNTLAAGSFTLNFTNAYTCPSASTLVYLTATGGNPGLGGTVNNSALVMLAALGQCGSLSSSTFIIINEVTTAATVEALAPFLNANGSIGSPSDSTSLQAIANAFAAVNTMVNISTGAALAGYPKLNTLANAMVPCVNSTGPTSSNCTTLFADATPSGGAAPTTVLGSLLDIALNPTLNGTAIYNLSTPNAPFQPALTSAPGVWNITTGGAAKSACGAAGGGDNVSGTVSYSGTAHGRIYLALNNPSGCDVGTEGTSIAAPGAFTIHGVPPGSYTLQAFMDTQGYGGANAANPMGSVTVNANNPNVTGANVTLTDPGTVILSTAPSLGEVGGFNSGIIVLIEEAKINGLEQATSYTLQWSTDAAFTTVAGSKTFPAVGPGTGVWLVTGLTDGSVYYLRAYGTSAGTPVGPLSSVFGPITGGAPSSGSLVSGTIGFSVAATGPMYAGLYNQNTNTVAPYVQYISSPVSLQPYSVTVPNSTPAVYIPVAIIDQNSNGVLDPGDISNVLFQGGPIAITGPTPNQNLTLPSGNVIAHVLTQAIQSGASIRYGLTFLLNFLHKQPVAVTLLNSYNTDGANIDTGPLDIASCAVPNTNCNSSNGFQLYFNLNSTVPTVGDSYFLNVTYSDGSSETIPVAVSNVLTAFATNLTPQTSGSGTTPTFGWSDPVCGACGTYTYAFYINDNTGKGLWSVPGAGNGLPPGTVSLPWGTDPTNSSNKPSVGSLTVGATYSWSITVQDSNFNQATQVVTYQP